MNSFSIIALTASILFLVEGLFYTIFPETVRKSLKQIFKNRKNTVKYGLIEIILALLILFLITI